MSVLAGARSAPDGSSRSASPSSGSPHPDAPAFHRPLRAGSVGVEFDTVAIGVPEVQRLADAVVRHPGEVPVALEGDQRSSAGAEDGPALPFGHDIEPDHDSVGVDGAVKVRDGECDTADGRPGREWLCGRTGSSAANGLEAGTALFPSQQLRAPI